MAATATSSHSSISSNGSAFVRAIAYEDLVVGDELGAGGFGVVYEGEWMHSKVAIKELLNVGVRSRRPEMFTREALKWSQLSHPHVLPLLGIAEKGEGRWMVSPLMENGCVRDYLEVNRKANRMKLIYNVASAVAYLHSKNCIHADLKPDNVLIHKSGDAVVGDFGAAKFRVSGKETTRGIRAGTERYMPPERITDRRAEVTMEMDVYSFGVTAYEMWSEDPPYSDLHEGFPLTNKIVEGKREFLWKYMDMPDELWELLVRCTEKDPRNRPQMKEVASIMKELAENGPPGPAAFRGTSSAGSSRISRVTDNYSRASRATRDDTPPYVVEASVSRDHVPQYRPVAPAPPTMSSAVSSNNSYYPANSGFDQGLSYAALPTDATAYSRTRSGVTGSGRAGYFADPWTQEEVYSQIREPRRGLDDEEDEFTLPQQSDQKVPTAVRVAEPKHLQASDVATPRGRRPPQRAAPRRHEEDESDSAPVATASEDDDDDADADYTPDPKEVPKELQNTIKTRLRSAGKAQGSQSPLSQSSTVTPTKTPRAPRTKSPPAKGTPGQAANGKARGKGRGKKKDEAPPTRCQRRRSSPSQIRIRSKALVTPRTPMLANPPGPQAHPFFSVPRSAGLALQGPRVRSIAFNELSIYHHILLGQGGFGAVYAGKWMHSRVAIKKLEIIGAKAKVADIFEREVLKWSHLNHPNILPLLGIAQNAGTKYMISPLMSNGNVIKYLDKNPGANRICLIYNLAAGLCYLHSVDFIHSDVKPLNVLVGGNGDAVLADFGAARFRLPDRGTTQGLRAGTDRYMPPERIMDRHIRVTKDMDVYSFGLTAYEIWTSQQPFGLLPEGWHLENAICQCKREFLVNCQSMPVVLRRLLLRCTDKDASVRPTMDEVARILEPLAEAEMEAIEGTQDSSTDGSDSSYQVLGNHTATVANTLGSIYVAGAAGSSSHVTVPIIPVPLVAGPVIPYPVPHSASHAVSSPSSPTNSDPASPTPSPAYGTPVLAASTPFVWTPSDRESSTDGSLTPRASQSHTSVGFPVSQGSPFPPAKVSQEHTGEPFFTQTSSLYSPSFGDDHSQVPGDGGSDGTDRDHEWEDSQMDVDEKAGQVEGKKVPAADNRKGTGTPVLVYPVLPAVPPTPTHAVHHPSVPPTPLSHFIPAFTKPVDRSVTPTRANVWNNADAVHPPSPLGPHLVHHASPPRPHHNTLQYHAASHIRGKKRPSSDSEYSESEDEAGRDGHDVGYRLRVRQEAKAEGRQRRNPMRQKRPTGLKEVEYNSQGY
ncbi:kinase-like protein [Gonapodya prolifera JEL478]|uniref:Kinase-like protein n=1 Tax=Gonapodya prolifera (strain JEL478) TaxID=1344416 RepID=A0A139AU39_GONPJ|nr:kinase-like protein [Gonapodya prolifera JEL478]|eukprot:KXS20214.1 kinase-like protein [Gonapodya prolifera JEL478]